ncbi:PIN domain-containing protein [Candidatus Woesearchaeota archaeon]|nr:PIN domain-containing protein [Candidatus Woesearchaeota archaeon]
MSFVFDTYALIEIIEGKPAYKKYVDLPVFINNLTYYEFYYLILRDRENQVTKILNLFNFNFLEIKKEHIHDAAKFRLKNKEKKLSFPDCLGYIMAEENKMKFLTGDKEFENFDNVEFVK